MEERAKEVASKGGEKVKKKYIKKIYRIARGFEHAKRFVFVGDVEEDETK